MPFRTAVHMKENLQIWPSLESPAWTIKALILQSLGVSWSIPKSHKRRGRFQVRIADGFFTSPQAPTGWKPTSVGNPQSFPVLTEVSLKQDVTLQEQGLPCSSAGLQIVTDPDFEDLFGESRGVLRISCLPGHEPDNLHNLSPKKNNKNTEIVLSKFWKCIQLLSWFPPESPRLKFLDLFDWKNSAPCNHWRCLFQSRWNPNCHNNKNWEWIKVR